MQLTILYNNKRLVIEEYGDKSIIQESMVMTYQFDNSVPTFFDGTLDLGITNDQTSLVNFGQVTQ